MARLGSTRPGSSGSRGHRAASCPSRAPRSALLAPVPRGCCPLGGSARLLFSPGPRSRRPGGVLGVVVLPATVLGAEAQGRTTSPMMPLAQRLGGGGLAERCDRGGWVDMAAGHPSYPPGAGCGE